MIDQVHRGRVAEPARLAQRVEQFGDGAGRFDPGRAAADDHDVQRFRHRFRRAMHLQQAMQVQSQPFGIHYGIERKRMFGRLR